MTAELNSAAGDTKHSQRQIVHLSLAKVLTHILISELHITS